MHLRISLLVSSLIASALSAAEPHSPWQLIGQWDNDLLTGSDDGYTNGARIAFVRPITAGSEEYYFLQNTLNSLTGSERGNRISNFRFPDEGEVTFQYGVGLTQLMFTPEDSTATTPPRGERPYASWLGLEFSLQAAAGDSASSATLSIGTTGKNSYGEEAQEWVHRNISDSPLFQGWDSQAPGELTINLHLDHKQRLRFLDHTQNWPIQIDGFYEWGGALGNFRSDAYLGALLRIGHNLPENYITPRVQLGSFTATIFDNERPANQDFAIYAYTGARGYAVLHDISLDGPLFRDWDESVDSEPWVGEFSFGIATRYKLVEVSLSHTLRSDEFKHQNNSSRYGSVLLRIGTQF
ncbi:MAG: hypothetical protein CML13_18230 [Puniceicoccaceae bacterium]|nr:hypothetical protein [Puniceicoccaceae bacterium]|tara:strand:+ start:9111 stop:10169 length:1059 start_codon:yes stop_codon:yes gene_type:complete